MQTRLRARQKFTLKAPSPVEGRSDNVDSRSATLSPSAQARLHLRSTHSLTAAFPVSILLTVTFPLPSQRGPPSTAFGCGLEPRWERCGLTRIFHTRVDFSIFPSRAAEKTGRRPEFCRWRDAAMWPVPKFDYSAVRVDTPPIRRGSRAGFCHLGSATIRPRARAASAGRDRAETSPAAERRC